MQEVAVSVGVDGEVNSGSANTYELNRELTLLALPKQGFYFFHSTSLDVFIKNILVQSL